MLKLHVQEGDEVRKGDRLMEVAPDMLEGKTESVIAAEKDWVVPAVSAAEGGAVQKGQPAAQVFEADTLRAVVQAEEEDLKALAEGDKITVTLDIDPEKYTYEGVIEKISYVPVQTAMGLTYEVTVSFENDGFVRMGTSVTVETK